MLKNFFKIVLYIMIFILVLGSGLEFFNGAFIGLPITLISGAFVVYLVDKIFFRQKQSQKSISNYEIKPKVLASDLELKSMMDEAYKDLRKIQAVYLKARHPDIKERGKSLLESGVSIFEFLKKNPSKIKLARRFLTYYLDTAAQIMTRYEGFSQTEINSPEMDKIYKDTESALEILDKSFNKQLIKLMQNEIMEFEVDIRVLKDTLKEEG